MNGYSLPAVQQWSIALEPPEFDVFWSLFVMLSVITQVELFPFINEFSFDLARSLGKDSVLLLGAI